MVVWGFAFRSNSGICALGGAGRYSFEGTFGGNLMAESVRGGIPVRKLGWLAGQVAGMVGVALCTNWALESRTRADIEQVDVLRDQVETAQFERDRMSRLNHELARELNEAAIAAEVARWQLRYTEERLRRTEAESRRAVVPAAQPSTERLVASSASERRPSLPGSLPARGPIEPLDAAAEAHLVGQIQRLAEGAARGGSSSPRASEAAPSQGSSSALEFERLEDVEIAAVAPVAFTERSAALSEWRAVLSETLAAECGNRSGARAHACRTDLERQLFPYSERAVRCLLSGNAEPDYVSVTEVERLPTHSVPLKRGALMLCDGALEHL